MKIYRNHFIYIIFSVLFLTVFTPISKWGDYDYRLMTVSIIALIVMIDFYYILRKKRFLKKESPILLFNLDWISLVLIMIPFVIYYIFRLYRLGFEIEQSLVLYQVIITLINVFVIKCLLMVKFIKESKYSVISWFIICALHTISSTDLVNHFYGREIIGRNVVYYMAYVGYVVYGIYIFINYILKFKRIKNV